MKKKDFLVCIKRTKWERDVERFGSAREARRIYRLQNHIFRRVYSSHVRQQRAIQQLQEALQGRADFIYREDLNADLVLQYNALVSMGGDNHFIYVARFAGPRPVIGINSDPRTSSGALVHFNTESFLACTKNPLFPDRFETWTMIEGVIHYPDGRVVHTGPCISETGIRNAFADAMSRYYIRINDEEWEEQKSSGLLLSTGAGSTGWFHNCLPHTMQIYEDPTFARDEQIFRLVAREPGFYKQHYYRYLYRTLGRGDILEIISEMDGTIIVDAQPETSFSFDPGCRAQFRLSDNHLVVAVP